MTSCVGDLFERLGKTHLLPSLYANPGLCMIRDVSHLSDAEQAELALSKELRKLMGEKEYARQLELGIGIAGASYEQRVQWYAAGLGNPNHPKLVTAGVDSFGKLSVLKGTGINDTNHPKLVTAGVDSFGKLNVAKKTGICSTNHPKLVTAGSQFES